MACMSINFFMYLRVLTRSVATILQTSYEFVNLLVNKNTMYVCHELNCMTHYLISDHLACLCRLLDVENQFLFLLLHCLTLMVQVSNGLSDGSLMLTDQLSRGHWFSKHPRKQTHFQILHIYRVYYWVTNINSSS